uniref:F-box domain-containing protein n=1 Tax=Caenorhabditis tropicalis TaxID=1561998 RepID=A0A1I7UT65_9PELO
MSFPLFRLPEVALEEVIKRFSPKEILFLVQLSLQSRRRISRHRKSYNVKIKVDDETNGSFVEISRDRQKSFKIQMTRDIIVSDTSWRFQRVVTAKIRNDTLVSYWNERYFDIYLDNKTAIQEVLDFLMEIFRIKEISFKFKKSCETRYALPIVENCISKKVKLGKLDWSFSGRQDIDERLLIASKGASDLHIRKYIDLPIQFYDFHLFRMDRFVILDASWMTDKQIADLRNCKRIELGYVCLDDWDINDILLEWMENPGELQKVRMCNYQNINIDKVVNGLNVIRIEEEGRKHWFIADNGIRFSATVTAEDIIVIERET